VASGTSLVLVTEEREIPTCVTHRLVLPAPVLLPGTLAAEPQHTVSEEDFTNAVRLQHIRVRYGDTLVLDGIDWAVRRGEKWALLRPNGSGKSTLLSLITADNPQAYANHVELFDRRRGRWALLARALVKQPPLLILDEPTQGLDATHTEAFSQLIDSYCLARPGTMLICVTHYPVELPRCITQTIRLEKGRVIA
jgi:ABC-type molybdenum transport system ATPase subunit/photorepair protein PhrA